MTSPLSLKEATAQMTADDQVFAIDEVDIRGEKLRVWRNAPPSLRAVLEMSRKHGAEEFIVYEDERLSFTDHFNAAASFAKALVAAGIQAGDRVAIAMRNLPEWSIAFWGAAAAGAVVVPINAWWTTEELSYGLADSGAKLLVVDFERYERIAGSLDQLDALSNLVVVDEDRAERAGQPHSRVHVTSFNSFLGIIADDVELPDVEIDSDDDATIFYTSGTTGRPKGAVGTHRNAMTNLMNLFFVGQRLTLRFGGGNVVGGEQVRNSYLLSVPLFHATGCLAILVVNLAAKGKLVMMRRFEPGRALELIAREQVTTFGGVPTMAMQILDHPDFASYDTSSVRSVSYGGAPAPPELVRRISASFPLGQPGNGYGMTETSAATTFNSGPDYVAKPDSVGPAVPVCDLAIVPEAYEGDRPDPNREQGPEVTGELWIRGPQVVRCYWKRPEETASTFAGGWLRTGDIARIDEEGFVYIVDRAKDVIIRGGENVYSVEVEAALFTHPAVADCAVIGIPEPVLGEEVGAVIVLRPGMEASVEELQAHVGEHLARFSVPSKIWFRQEAIPRNPAGKILKRQLRDEISPGS